MDSAHRNESVFYLVPPEMVYIGTIALLQAYREQEVYQTQQELHSDLCYDDEDIENLQRTIMNPPARLFGVFNHDLANALACNERIGTLREQMLTVSLT